jgi:hypothetical protein
MSTLSPPVGNCMVRPFPMEAAMEELGIHQDSSAWVLYVKLSFGLALLAMIAGIAILPVSLAAKGYLTMGTLFLAGSSISLSKTLRDQHESKRWINRLVEARAEELLKRFEGEE